MLLVILIKQFKIIVITDIILPISLYDQNANSNNNSTNTELITDTIYLDTEDDVQLVYATI